MNITTQEKKASSHKYHIPGLEKGLKVLLIFAEQQKELTFAELLQLVDIPKATTYRILQTLEYLGFLERNPRTNQFYLSLKVLSLGFGYIASLDVAQLGQPIIEQLRDQTNYNSHLAIRDGQHVIYIGRVSAAGSQINHVSVGTRLPAHRTSLGRMLLSELNKIEFEHLYPEPILPDKGGDREQFWKMLQDDRKRGYVIGESFFRRGISSIVYPVFNKDGHIVAVISIMVPLEEIPTQEREKLSQQVQLSAKKLTEFLGGTIPNHKL